MCMYKVLSFGHFSIIYTTSNNVHLYNNYFSICVTNIFFVNIDALVFNNLLLRHKKLKYSNDRTLFKFKRLRYTRLGGGWIFFAIVRQHEPAAEIGKNARACKMSAFILASASPKAFFFFSFFLFPTWLAACAEFFSRERPEKSNKGQLIMIYCTKNHCK